MAIFQTQSHPKHDTDAPRGEYHPQEKPNRTSPQTPGNMNEKKKKKPDWKQLGAAAVQVENRTKPKKKRGKSEKRKLRDPFHFPILVGSS